MFLLRQSHDSLKQARDISIKTVLFTWYGLETNIYK